MTRTSRIVSLLFLPLLLCGCAARITNLTPSQQPRNAEGMYPVEFAFESRQQTIRWDTITPSVIIGEQHLPMTRVELVPNRWEGLLPVPASENLVHYRFRVDFECNDFGPPTPDSAISPSYSLRITGE
jgi:hypothetical protein